MTKSNSIQIIVIALLLVFITSCKITTKARVDKFSTYGKITFILQLKNVTGARLK